MNELMTKLYEQKNLELEEMKSLSQQLFKGELSEAQIGALLIGLKIKGETAEEMAGLAETIREFSMPIDTELTDTICNCGTGGDLSNSFNISTTAAFVLAAAGMKVAKTGNRSISSKAGSFDTCEALGIDFLVSAEQQAQQLAEINLTFLFAPHVHPRMKYVMPARKTLGTPTIMNLIGPLTNPVALEYQLMGINRRSLLKKTAETIQKLGRKRAIVVNGPYEMDEASLAGETHYVLLAEGKITRHVLKPEDVGLPYYDYEAIQGGDANQNAEILLNVLKGHKSPYYDTVLLNAGLGLFAGGKVSSVQEGVHEANQLLQSGAAYQVLTDLLAFQANLKVGN